MKFFKGYVPTKNKQCLMKFKDKGSKELLTLDEAKKLDEYAGILSEDTILIDIDDYDQSEILMDIVEDLQLDCRVYKTTRGKHFFFKNNGIDKCYTHVKLALGITADIKVGVKNSYSVLKFSGKEREIIYDVFEGEEYQSLPKFLTPVKSNVDFLNLSEGDGRNQTLFNYILILQMYGLNKEEIKECLSLINKYVMKDSLGESELNTITRDEAFKPVEEVSNDTNFFADRVFLFDKFAHYIKDHACIKNINGNLHIYKDGVYVDGTKYIEQEMITHIKTLKAAQRTEVLKYLHLIVPEGQMSSEYKIAFNNGLYDLTTGELEPFDSEVVITNKIPFDYDESAYSQIADNTLNKLACGNKNVRLLLEEYIGYHFFRRNELRKAFFLVGDKKNGKSTFLQLLGYLLGDGNLSFLGLDDLGDRFRTAEIVGKLGNIGDDIDDDFISKTGIFKKVVSGSEILVERKGQDPFKTKPYCKFSFSCNDTPKFKDRTGAVKDRLVFIPFNATFTKDDPDFDPFIISKLMKPEVAEYLIQIGLDGLVRVLKNKAFTETAEGNKELEAFDERNNPIIKFCKELTIDDVENKVIQDLFVRYLLWCEEEGCLKLGKGEFTKFINKTFDTKSEPRGIEGKRVRCFIKK